MTLLKDSMSQLRALLIFAVSLLGACQLALDVDREQCATDQQCVELFGREYTCGAQRTCEIESASENDAGRDSGGSDLPPEWACLDKPQKDIAPIDDRFVSVRFLVTSYDGFTVPDNLVARACRPQNVNCDAPVATITPDPNDESYLRFDMLPYGFKGFIWLTAEPYLDALIYVNEPFWQDENPEGPTVSTIETLMAINDGQNDDIPFKETDGLILASVRDCFDNAAAGVSFVLDSSDEEDNEEHPFYFEGSLPVRTREFTAISTQLTRGGAKVAVGGFSHITPGYPTITAVLAKTGHVIDTMSVQVREKTLTYVDIHAGY